MLFFRSVCCARNLALPKIGKWSEPAPLKDTTTNWLSVHNPLLIQRRSFHKRPKLPPCAQLVFYDGFFALRTGGKNKRDRTRMYRVTGKEERSFCFSYVVLQQKLYKAIIISFWWLGKCPSLPCSLVRGCISIARMQYRDHGTHEKPEMKRQIAANRKYPVYSFVSR